YCLDYGTLGVLGDPTSRVYVPCEVTAPGYQLPAVLPNVSHRIGIDREPIDLTNEDDRRWLLACVWPDTGRLERTAEALQIAATHPPDVRQGDMIGDLASTIDPAAADGAVCVMTSWAAAYLSPSERYEFASVLAEVGTQREVVWLSLEIAGVVDMVDDPVAADGFEIEPSVIGLTRFQHGTRQDRVLGLVPPHGRTLRRLHARVAARLPRRTHDAGAIEEQRHARSVGGERLRAQEL